MKLALPALLLGVSLAFGADAARLYAQGQAAEKAGRFDKAYVLYSEAAALDPANRTYWLRSQAVRSRAALQAKLLPPSASGALPLLDAEKLPPAATLKDLADARQPQAASELKADRAPHDFDLQGTPRMLFQNVGRAFGLDCVFDTDYPAAGNPIRFHVEGLDYRAALHALEAATGSFVVPLSRKLFMVARDTTQKRNDLEQFISVAIDIPQATSQQEVTEVVRAVQQAMALDKVGVDAQQNLVILRGPASKVIPARLLFEDLIHHHPQVAVEIELIEVNKQDMLTYGLALPTSYLIQNFDSASKLGTQLSRLATGGIGGMAFGLAIGESQLLAQMNDSIGRSLYQMQLRSVDGQAATVHVGDRYPVLTTGYFGQVNSSAQSNPLPSSSNGTGASNSNSGTSLNPSAFGNVPNPSGLATGDFNHDGILDIAAAASGGDEVAVQIGNGNGTFQDAVMYPTGTNPSAIAAADLNGDGFLDLVTADAGSNSISILLGKGDGTFAAATHVAVGTTPAALAIADLNADGFPDIVVANSASNNLSILRGSGDGTFRTPFTISTGTSPRSVIALDLNEDGAPDLAVANFTSNDLWVYLGNGDATFGQPVTYATGNSPRAVFADNVTTSGLLDLVVANSASNTVSVFVNRGGGQFADGVQYITGNGPVSLAGGDFNSDGLQDIAAANYSDGTVSLLLGLGNGAFEAPIAFNADAGPVSIVGGDFNDDGLRDLVVANFTANNFSLLLGAGTGAFHDSNGNYYSPSGGQVYTPPPAFSFQDLGLSIKVTPHIHGMESITLDLEAEVQLLSGASLDGVPVISHRKLASQVRLKNGEWGAVAGLLSTSEARSIAGIAGLATLPAIGPLMRQTTKNKDDDQVLILIKTELLSPPPDQFVTHTVPVGTETRPLSQL